MFGFLFWLLITILIIGFVGASLNTLMAQRAAWKLFAKKYNLKYERETGIYGHSRISGQINNRTLSIYSLTDIRPFARTRQMFVHIEVGLNTKDAPLILISAKALPDIISNWGLPEELSLSLLPIKAHTSQTTDPSAAQQWIKQGKRLRGIGDFLQNINEAEEAVFTADGNTGMLLWRTSAPLSDARDVNATVQKLFGYAREIES